MSKPKLLITLGCSLTEGQGCYGDLKEEDVNNTPIELIKERFHEYSWPSQLAKKLNYNKVINLGLGGSSTSGQLKQFSEKYLDMDLSKYSVLVMWMLPDPSRYSFYINSRIQNYMCAWDDDFEIDFSRAYINEMKDTIIDPSLEQVFYIKMIEQICENKGYDLLLFSESCTVHETLEYFYKSKHYLSVHNPNLFHFENYQETHAPFDKHPNELGYELIANEIYNCILSTHSHLINKNLVTEFESIWDGEPKIWK